VGLARRIDIEHTHGQSGCRRCILIGPWRGALIGIELALQLGRGVELCLELHGVAIVDSYAPERPEFAQST
jgi:hypothetical protein